jgi:hypothetical protein
MEQHYMISEIKLRAEPVRNTINSPPPTHKCARGLSLNG